MQSNDKDVFIFPDIDMDGNFKYSIGHVAARFDLTLRAVRFYCEIGLIKECSRDGARYFDVQNIKRLSLILKAKFLGLSLAEISTMIIDDRERANGLYLAVPTARIDEGIKNLEVKRDFMLSQLQALSSFKGDTTTSIAA